MNNLSEKRKEAILAAAARALAFEAAPGGRIPSGHREAALDFAGAVQNSIGTTDPDTLLTRSVNEPYDVRALVVAFSNRTPEKPIHRDARQWLAEHTAQRNTRRKRRASKRR